MSENWPIQSVPNANYFCLQLFPTNTIQNMHGVSYPNRLGWQWDFVYGTITYLCNQMNLKKLQTPFSEGLSDLLTLDSEFNFSELCDFSFLEFHTNATCTLPENIVFNRGNLTIRHII